MVVFQSETRVSKKKKFKSFDLALLLFQLILLNLKNLKVLLNVLTAKRCWNLKTLLRILFLALEIVLSVKLVESLSLKTKRNSI